MSNFLYGICFFWWFALDVGPLWQLEHILRVNFTMFMSFIIYKVLVCTLGARLVWTFYCVQRLHFGHGTHATVNASFFLFSFFFFFVFTRFRVMRLLFMHYCMNSNRKCWLSTVNSDSWLFTDPQIPLFNNFFIKNGSHGNIHTFKKYFATVFSVLVFSFSKNKLNPNRL